ncbi:MAG TPA: hypothetical protein VM597_16700 [Gemmataceae bacterium]|jgi:hypothetical protein|nr:hypothetical protein [Gemmataceae bacterium]
MPIETDFINNAKDVAKRYSFLPANAAAGYDLTATTQTDLDGAFAGFRHTVVNNDQKVARVTLQITMTNRGEACTVRPSLNATAGIPVYFLPWDERGAAVEMTIPNLNPALSEDNHPRFFFTAVLSGCSILFKGTAQRPTIYHCGTGGTTGGGAPTVGDSNTYFLNLLRDVELKGLGRTDTGLPHAPRQVLSSDYMVRAANDGAAPTLDANLRTAVTNHFGGRMVLEEVVLWGSVFGLRPAGSRDWKFYLQQNATVQFKPMEAVLQDIEVKQKKKFGPFTYTKKHMETRSRFHYGNMKAIAKPIQLTQVFPGAGVAKVTNSWRSLV